jgi:hypothetical protein
MPAFALVFLAILSHVLPHPWISFTAVGGSLLFFGARRPLWQAVSPIALLAVSDWYLTVFAYRYPFHPRDYLVTWAWYALTIGFGRIVLRQRASASRVVGAALLSSTSFFLASNYAVWAAGSLYPHTAGGLLACVLAAVPFYRNDLLSTLLVAGLAFGLPALLRRSTLSQRPQAPLS